MSCDKFKITAEQLQIDCDVLDAYILNRICSKLYEDTLEFAIGIPFPGVDPTWLEERALERRDKQLPG